MKLTIFKKLNNLTKVVFTYNKNLETTSTSAWTTITIPAQGVKSGDLPFISFGGGTGTVAPSSFLRFEIVTSADVVIVRLLNQYTFTTVYVNIIVFRK
ncbi:MAG: hypothetical protein ACRCY7_07840 [Cetobacterium sp.]|uniref:hypothetical protein n=1 Tax=Cetobacterium sp. TaxID=2071632 RepID=UPI003F2C4DE0